MVFHRGFPFGAEVSEGGFRGRSRVGAFFRGARFFRRARFPVAGHRWARFSEGSFFKDEFFRGGSYYWKKPWRQL